ncbi:TPA: hypothetical protein HA361_04340 [Candidatus Woesearchaeota archaeon]|nr:hypothetical protein [Candidatus Woesearchaeota archaeon]HII68947.1 hypothetical protein [Candidatus Woesearchaeota archaeon]
MSLDQFERKLGVKKAEKDPALIASLIKTAKKDMEFLATIEVNDLSARKVMGNYYDALRAMLEAIALDRGYKVYSHEAFTEFLKGLGHDAIGKQFDRFRRIRNSINYYGTDISVEEVSQHKEDIIRLIDKVNLLFRPIKKGGKP